MAQSTKAEPSIEGIFRILASIPENQLLKFKHKLNCIKQDRRNCQLLQAMILLTLRQEVKARMSLDALGDDAMAAHIYRSHSGCAKANNPLSPKQDLEMAMTIAQIYSLLADEQLCDPQARVEAYRAPLKTAKASNNVEGPKPNSLIDEAQGKGGLEFGFPVVNYDFSALRSGAGKFTVPTARSYPLPIKNVSVPPDPQSLRSTGTSDSFASHLEISQSPTVPLLTCSVHQPGISSKLCESASNLLAETGEGRDSLKLPASCLTEGPAAFSAQDKRKSSLLVSPDIRAAPPLGEGVNHPVECTELQTIEEAGLQDSEGSIPPHWHVSYSLQPGSATQECVSPSLEDSHSPAQNTDCGPFSLDSPVPPMESLSRDPQYDQRQFFTFVVLHADEDELIACRVKDLLENMGVSNGATLSENFLIPGHCQLSSFQNALDNSAFTLLLLTENFNSRICAYHTSVALTDSFTRLLKTNSVIPFVPKENPIRRLPILLSGIVPLDENLPIFTRKVKNTFTSNAIEVKRREWKRERLEEQHHNYLLMQQRLSEISIAGCPTQMPFPPPQTCIPGLQHAFPGYTPFFRPTFPAPEVPQTQPFLSQPPLIIQNAQMVQIGDYNQMQVERTSTSLPTTDEEVDRNQALEGEGAGERTDKWK